MEKEKKAVALIMIPAWTNINRPGPGEYSHPMVKKIIPCWKVGDKYFDLRSNVEVEKKETFKHTFLEWPILTGVVFEYQDHSRFLLTRSYFNGKLKFIPFRSKEEFNSLTMLLHKVI